MNVHGQMTEAEKKAEKMRLKDAETLERRKKKFDAARFAHIENTNKIHGQPNLTTPKPAPEQSKASNEKQESKRKGWRIFKKKNKDENTTLLKESTNPTPPTAKSPPPIAARSIKPTNIRQEVSAGWASVDKQNERPQPNVGHSSDPNYPRPESSTTPAYNVPPAVSKKSPTPPAPEQPKYKTVGYGATGKKPVSSVSGTIAAFQAGAPAPKTGNPRQMKEPKVVTSTSESMDARGNITRTITRQITEPDGKTRTETEVIEKPAKR